MNQETIKTSLTSLKTAGSVFGVILAKEEKVLYTDTPFSMDRVQHVAAVLDDIGFYFKKEGRSVDQLAFGYDGGNVLTVVDEPYRLVVFHALPDEVDLIAKSARAFLIDFETALFAGQFERQPDQDQALEAVNPPTLPDTPEQVEIQQELRPATQRITLKAERGFDDTEPLQPRTGVARLSPNQPESTLPPPRTPRRAGG